MNTITCTKCQQIIEIDKALEGQIEARVLEAANHKHQVEVAKITAEAEASAQRTANAATEIARKEAAANLEIAKNQIESEAKSAQKKSRGRPSVVNKIYSGRCCQRQRRC